jgi:hypothetical protein
VITVGDEKWFWISIVLAIATAVYLAVVVITDTRKK